MELAWGRVWVNKRWNNGEFCQCVKEIVQPKGNFLIICSQLKFLHPVEQDNLEKHIHQHPYYELKAFFSLSSFVFNRKTQTGCVNDDTCNLEVNCLFKRIGVCVWSYAGFTSITHHCVTRSSLLTGCFSLYKFFFCVIQSFEYERKTQLWQTRRCSCL